MNRKGSTAIKSVADKHPQVILIPLRNLSTSPYQVRRHFDKTELERLAESIRSEGIIHPITVMDSGTGKYTIIAGERRFRAAQMLHMDSIPAIVTDSKDALEIGIIENLQRQDLKPIEKCEAFHRLKKEKGYTDSQIGQIAGISRSSVNEFLALDRLPEQIKKECRTSDTPKSILYEIVTSFGNPVEMLDAWHQCKKHNLTVRQFREFSNTDPPGKTSDSRKKPFSHKNMYPDFGCAITISSRKINVDPEDVVKALEKELPFWEGEVVKKREAFQKLLHEGQKSAINKRK